MVQKSSMVKMTDKTGVLYGRIFHIYKGSVRKTAKIGDIVKLSIREKTPTCFLKKGGKSKAILVRANFIDNRPDGSYIRFFENRCVLLKRRLSTRSKRVLGPSLRSIKKKKFVYRFVAAI